MQITERLLLVVAESYTFHQAKQEAGESVAVFANRLKRLAVNCKFNLFLQRALRDQFVCSIRNGNTLKKLLSQDKSFEECLNISLADAAAERESKGFTNFPSGYESVNYMKSKKFCKIKLKCFCCGSEKYLASRCTIKSSGITCSYCNKPNHLARECFKKRMTRIEERKALYIMSQMTF